MHQTSLALILAWGLLSTTARAQPTGFIKKLPLKPFKIEIAVDDLQSLWKVNLPPRHPGSDFDSIVFLAHPYNETITISMIPGLRCAAAQDGPDADTHFGSGHVTATSLGLDAMYYATVHVEAGSRGTLRYACADVAGGGLVAAWMQDPQEDAALRASAARVINAFSTAYRDRANDVPQHLQLAEGIAIDVHDRSVLWHVEDHALLRVDDDSGLAVNVASSPTGTCEDDAKLWRSMHWDISNAPSWLPRGWLPDTALAKNGVDQMVVTCMARNDGGVIELQWVKADPSSPEFGRVARPLLEAFATAFGVPPPPPAAPPPPPEPTVATAPEPASPIDTSATYASPVTASSADSEPTNIAGQWVSSPTMSLGYQQLTPTTTALPHESGAVLGIAAPLRSLANDALAYEVGTRLGYDDHSSLAFDVYSGLGYEVGLGRLRVIPAAGLEIDYLGGGDAGSYQLDTSIGFYLAVAARLGLGEHITLEGRGTRLYRSGPIDESTLSGGLVITRRGHRKLAVEGFTRTYDGTGMSAASQYGISAGVGF